WLDIPVHWNAPQQKAIRWVGTVPLAVGTVIMLWCVFGFAFRGKGTPAPFDAPRHLVIAGLYRYVRNPMYWGLAVAVIGEAVLFADFRPPMLPYMVLFVMFFGGFVLLYEEPTLRRKFGREYEQYCAEVPRWFPRFTRSKSSVRAFTSSR